MTEQEWLECADPQKMLGFLEGKASDRKLWLFACSSCRRHTRLLSDAPCRTAIEVGERYADGQATADELMEASEGAFCRRNDLKSPDIEAAAIAAAFAVIDPANRDPNMPLLTTASAVQGTSDDLLHFVMEVDLTQEDRTLAEVASQQAVDAERKAQAELLRDIFGNPFRPADSVSFRLGSKVVKLAQAFYDDRTFNRMPELADVLEEAGCDNMEVLTHLREPKPHVRGCWALDLLLGKE